MCKCFHDTFASLHISSLVRFSRSPFLSQHVGFAQCGGGNAAFLPSDGVQTSSEHSCSYVTSRGGHAGNRCPVVCSNVVHLNGVQVWNAIKAAHYIDVVVEQCNAGTWTWHNIFCEKNDWGTRWGIFTSHFLSHLNAWWPWVSRWSSDLCVGHTAPLSSVCSDHRIHLWGDVMEKTDAKWKGLTFKHLLLWSSKPHIAHSK